MFIGFNIHRVVRRYASTMRDKEEYWINHSGLRSHLHTVNKVLSATVAYWPPNLRYNSCLAIECRHVTDIQLHYSSLSLSLSTSFYSASFTFSSSWILSTFLTQSIFLRLRRSMLVADHPPPYSIKVDNALSTLPLHILSFSPPGISSRFFLIISNGFVATCTHSMSVT